MLTSRSPWQVTRSVWYALFVREALARTMADRLAWFWMIAEPAAMIVIFVLIRTVILGRDRHIAGADFVPWLIVGLFGFYLFQENMMRSVGAIEATKGLFTYRQVKTVDPVLVRCYLEGILKTFIFFLFILAGLLLDLRLLPDVPLSALFSWLSLWALGLGAGLSVSAINALVPEVGRIVRMASLPLLIISGVIFPLNFLPFELQRYLLWNPIVHGIETLRMGFSSSYQPLLGVDITYLWFWALGLICLGIMLHIRFTQRLKAK